MLGEINGVGWQVGEIVSYISEIVGSLLEERKCGQ